MIEEKLNKDDLTEYIHDMLFNYNPTGKKYKLNGEDCKILTNTIMKEKIKDLGWGILGIAFMFGIMLLALLFIKGGLWLSGFLYHWLFLISLITFFSAIVS